MQDRNGFRSTLAVGGAGTVAVVVLYAWYRGWHLPRDEYMGRRAGLALLHGHLGAVYGDKNLYELPLSLPFTGFVALLTQWLHLRTGRNLVIATDVAYLLPCLAVIHWARGLAWDLGARRRMILVQLCVFVAIALPELQWGHPEDVMALAFTVAAVRSTLGSRQVAAAVYMSLAVSSKQWAMMLIPMVVLSAPAGRRLRSMVLCVAAPVALVSVFLTVNFQAAIKAFAAPATFATGTPGHLWINPTWLGTHTSQANRAAAVMLAVTVTWRCRNLLRDPLTLATLAVFVLALRPLTETVNFSYYWSPVLSLAVVVAVAAHPERRLVTWAPAVGAILWSVPTADAMNGLVWWIAMAVLLVMVARQLPRRGDELDRPEVTAPPRSLTAVAGR